MEQLWGNLWYRYGAYMDVFENLQLNPETKKLLYDSFFQLVRNCERKSVSSAADYDRAVRMEEIKQGIYGSSQQENFEKMKQWQQKQAAHYMLLQEQAGESLKLYGKAMTTLLKDGVLYKNRRKKNHLLLYMGREQKVEDMAVINFVNKEFLPFGYTIEIYWERSFGVIGDERCMELDGILLY